MGSLVTLFSDALKDAMMQFGVDNIDYFPVEIEAPATQEVETGWWLANVLGLVECVDLTRSTIVPRPAGAKGRLEAFYVDPQRTRGLHIFRLAEDPTLIILDEDLRRFLQSMVLRGIRMRHKKSLRWFLI
jgi:hypothetical protein